MAWKALLAAALAALGGAARAQGGPEPRPDAEKTLSPYFFVQDGDPALDRMPLESTTVQATVSGVIAEVTVRQRYRNDGARPINAVYVFPASTRAAVHGLTMTVADRVVRARIKEREAARKEYEAAKSAGKNAALLEQERPNVFRMSLSNVMPGDRIEVELRYSELLVPEDGVYEFVYPTVVGPRYSGLPAATAPASERWISNPTLREGVAPQQTLELFARLSAGMPIESLASPSHKVRVDWKGKDEAAVSLDASERGGGDRDFVLRYRLSGGEIRSGLLLSEEGDEKFFLLMVQPPERIRPEQIPPREFVFVLDVSGSMFGFPLDTAKALMRDLVGRLKPTDAFNVLFFSGGSSLLAPSSLPATPENLRLATAMVESQRGGGGTELLAAVRRAMALPVAEGRSRSIVVVTDGYIGLEKEVFDHVRSNLGRANVYAFGIGSSVNRHLIEGVAKAGLGEPFIVLRPDHAAREAERFREYIEAPVLTQAEVRFDGFDAYDVEPNSIPDVLAERPVLVFGKWRGERKGKISLSGLSGRGPWKAEFSPQGAELEPGGALRVLWARRRAADLSDLAFGPETPERREELVRLGLKYDLLTRHTSFIAVHDVVRNAEGGAQDVRQPLPLPQGVSSLAVGELRHAPEPELRLLVLWALAGLGALRISRRLSLSPRAGRG